MAILEVEINIKPLSVTSYSHVHKTYEFYYLIHGERDYIIGDSIYKIKKGTFIMINPNVPHMTRGGLYTRFLASFDDNFFDFIPSTIIKTCFSKNIVILIPEQQKFFEQLMEKIYNESIKKNEDSKVLEKLYFAEMLTLLYRLIINEKKINTLTIKQKSHPQIIYDISLFVKKNINIDITVNDISKKFFVSVSHLSRIFKASTGFTLINYINNVRLNEVLKYLSTSNYSISKIAALCGYSSANYLSLNFKKNFGISPLNYKKSIIKLK